MRALLAIAILLTGCDKLFSLIPVADSSDAGRGGDGGRDALGMDTGGSIDGGPHACQVTPFTGGAVAILPSATHYATDEPRVHAAALVGTTIDYSAADSSIVASASLPALAGDQFDDPRLAPEGNELFVRVTNDISGAIAIKSYQLVSTVWTLEGALSIDGSSSFGATAQPGVPSRQNGARVMMLDAGGTFVEILETAPLTWKTVHTYDTTQLISSSAMHDPSLTADGLRFVFIDYTEGTDAAFVAQAVWSVADQLFMRDQNLVLTGSTGGNTPYLSADCKHLYVTNGANMVVRYDE